MGLNHVAQHARHDGLDAQRIAGAHGALAVANLFLGGVLFGLLAIRTGNLYAAAAAHFAWNWTESGVFGLSEQPTGSLFRFAFTGTPLWNGGADAMNGSLAMSLGWRFWSPGWAWRFVRRPGRPDWPYRPRMGDTA